MKKKKYIISFISGGVLILLLLAAMFFLPFQEGAYRSQMIEILSDGYQGYLYLYDGNIYIVNLSGSDLTNDKVECLGKYKHISGNEYSFIWKNKTYKFETGLLGMQWLNSEFNELPTSPLEGRRVLWPSTKNKIKSIVDTANKKLSKKGSRGEKNGASTSKYLKTNIL